MMEASRHGSFCLAYSWWQKGHQAGVESGWFFPQHGTFFGAQLLPFHHSNQVFAIDALLFQGFGDVVSPTSQERVYDASSPFQIIPWEAHQVRMMEGVAL